jgi:2'-5' RNA ligase
MLSSSDRAGKFRAFVALKPPPVCIAELSGIQAALRKELGSRDYKWVDPEQMHITLRFFGSIAGQQVAEIVAKLTKATAGVSSFILRAGTLGCFPSSRKPRVLWMGVQDSAQQSALLQRRIQKETGDLGQAPEDRPFSPHLTLARVKEPDRAGRELLERLLRNEWTLSADWQVSEVLLMQSHLSRQGATYEILHAAALHPAE